MSSSPSGKGCGPSRARLYELDLLRLIAALAVVVFHFAFNGYAASGPSAVAYAPLEGPARYGYLGVELFFMISGFVILMTARVGSLYDFAASRFVRLYPAFWICCTLTAIAGWAFADPNPRFHVGFSQYLVNMTMLSEFVGVKPIDTVYWTLFCEIRFYLMVALVLAFGWMHHVERLLWGWWVVTTLSLLLQGTLRIGPLWHWLNVEYAALFISGATLYLVHESGMTRGRLWLLCLCWMVTVWHFGFVKARDFGEHYNVVFSPWVIGGAITIFYWLIYAIADSRLPWFRRAAWVPLGAMTYPLYLVHQNVGYQVFNRWHNTVNLHLLFWGSIAGMLALAYGIQRWVERPIASRMKIWLKP